MTNALLKSTIERLIDNGDITRVYADECELDYNSQAKRDLTLAYFQTFPEALADEIGRWHTELLPTFLMAIATNDASAFQALGAEIAYYLKKDIIDLVTDQISVSEIAHDLIPIEEPFEPDCEEEWALSRMDDGDWAYDNWKDRQLDKALEEA